MSQPPNQIPKAPELDTSQKNRENYLRWQHNRLNYFLVASAFLVAAFFQLVGNHPSISCITFKILINSVAGLGSVIAEIYCFINFFVSFRALRDHQGDDSNIPQTAHTWIIPALFLIFWIITWALVNPGWYIGGVIIGLLLACALFQGVRHRLNRFLYEWYKWYETLFYKIRELYREHRYILLSRILLEILFLGLYYPTTGKKALKKLKQLYTSRSRHNTTKAICSSISAFYGVLLKFLYWCSEFI